MLLQEIEKVKLEMETAYSNFQNVMDPDLIDCCIYESNAAHKKECAMHIRRARAVAKQ